MDKSGVGLLGGTGIEGRGIALRLAAAGIDVTLGSRSESRALQVAEQLNAILREPRILGASNSEVVRRCGLLFLTVPFQFAADLLQAHADEITPEHVVVDVTVPLVFEKGPRLMDLEENSGAEHLRLRLSREVPLAATFKTIPAHLLFELDEPLDCDEVICWDSEEARDRVLVVLSKVAGIRWLDGGPLRFCRALEAMTMLVVGLNRRYKAKHGRFKVMGL